MSVSKIKIKLGAIEVEYEGSEAFLKEELPSLLAAVSDLYQKSAAPLAAFKVLGEAPTVTPPDTTSTAGSTGSLQMTTGAIASRLQVKSGADLVMAAAAHLKLVAGQSTFPRQGIIDQMKEATAFYRATYVSNLSATLKTLLKENKLNEPSKGVFALTHGSEQELKARLA